jgi:hypothetical protein
MSRLFGWDLPPGVTTRMINEAAGGDGPCEVCGYDVEACVCPECPTCQEQGRPECYSRLEGRVWRRGHSLRRTKAQLIGAQRLKEAALKAQLQDAEQYRAWLETLPEGYVEPAERRTS